jgi:peptidoglycan/LPS O-acetylase OafA/YrhL
MIYRREIDGLRAVAVVPVILFHAGLTVFSGGYVGVDVFFVISGFLITSILIDELTQGSFSITRFYERRARRILPALFFVMLCCIPFAWVWMLPSELKSFSQSLVAVTLFTSNILFWYGDGYFASATELKPLLHTWSLAVEEQYYLLFPLSLMLLWPFGRKRLFWTIVCVTIVSFLISEWGWRNKPSANFYLAPTRAWELLAGSICAFWLSGRDQPENNWLSSLGLAAIFVAIFCYDENTPFPSIYALVPVVGTALVIVFGGAGTWTARLLSARPFVGIGLISYSAYLWHQPLFAFARIRIFPEPKQLLMMALSFITLILAYFSWRYIEMPFRKGKNSLLLKKRTLFISICISAAAFLIFGFLGYLHEGFASRSRGLASAPNVEDRLIVNYGLHSECEGEFNLSANCYTSKKPRVLLWGDSYAMHLVQGILASDPQIALQQHTLSSCSPILDVAPSSGHTKLWVRRCIAFNDNVLNWLHQNSSIDLVILSSSFVGVTTGEVMARDGQKFDADDITRVRSALIRTVKKIRSNGTRVIIVSPPPVSGWDNGLCVARAAFANISNEKCLFAFNSREKPLSLLRSVEQEVPIFWLSDAICPQGTCNPKQGGVFIYRDKGHLSKEGSAYLGRTQKWMDQFRIIAR